MLDTPDFNDPPVVELVLGAQFSPLTKLTTGHYGLFWNQLGEEWTSPSDGPPLDDQFEQFDRSLLAKLRGLEIRLEPVRVPSRFMLGHRSDDRLLQIQPSRFHFNWRKRDDFYPSYRRLIAEFEEMFERFESFVQSAGLGRVAVNQWELTYIDAFAQDHYWKTPEDWSSFLPGLFGSLRVAEGLVLETRAAEWRYEIPPNRGRLHITARPGRMPSSESAALLLEMTARGPVGRGGASTLREGLDWGHDAAVGTFLTVASDDVKTRWGGKK